MTTLSEMAVSTTKNTKSSGNSAAVKHLAATSPGTRRAIERYRARQAAAGKPVAYLVKR